MGRSVLPRPRQSAIGCEKTAVRQVARARRPPVQPYRIDDIGRHVGAGFGRRPSISRRMSANSRREIATSAIWKVTYSTVLDHPRVDLDQLLSQPQQWLQWVRNGRQGFPENGPLCASKRTSAATTFTSELSRGEKLELDGCQGNASPSAAESKYDFRDLGAYLEDVGLGVRVRDRSTSIDGKFFPYRSAALYSTQ